MNKRKFFIEYINTQIDEDKPKAIGFIEIEQGWYNYDTLIYLDENNKQSSRDINYKSMFHWLIKKYNKDLKIVKKEIRDIVDSHVLKRRLENLKEEHIILKKSLENENAKK